MESGHFSRQEVKNTGDSNGRRQPLKVKWFLANFEQTYIWGWIGSILEVKGHRNLMYFKSVTTVGLSQTPPHPDPPRDFTRLPRMTYG